MTIVEKRLGRGRPRAFDRDVVLERAMQVFWNAGYESASVPMLTKAMRISAQSLYAAFGSKEALYREAVEFYRATLGGFAARALSEEPDAPNAIRRLLREAAETFSRTTGTPGCMIATPTAAGTETELVELGSRLRRASAAMIAERLERGIRENQVRHDIDCAAWSSFIAATVQGMAIQARDGADTTQLLGVAELASQNLATMRPT